jgi:hypothetical protein
MTRVISIREWQKQQMRRAVRARSYRSKIERGECGHCPEPLAFGSESCCEFHLKMFREKGREQRRAA